MSKHQTEYTITALLILLFSICIWPTRDAIIAKESLPILLCETTTEKPPLQKLPRSLWISAEPDPCVTITVERCIFNYAPDALQRGLIRMRVDIKL